jgi:phage baseplate assembly protein W|tara:strand:+ start:148 stop:594 length:447 start_codon:yes stop_codon:yes gene_type:complete
MATYVSDKSITSSGKASIISAKKKEYRDLDLSLTLHPVKKDIVPLRDDKAIKNAIKNLLVTNFFERPFRPDLGANLSGLLFEPADMLSSIAIQDNIKKVIVDHEPRVDVQSVTVVYDVTDDAYRAIIKYIIKENDVEDLIDIRLRRLR